MGTPANTPADPTSATAASPTARPPRVLRITFALSVLYIAGTVLGTILIVAQALFASAVSVALPTARFWPTLHPSVELTGPTAQVSGGGFTSADLEVTGLDLATRLVLAGGHLVQGATLVILGVAVATVCSRLRGNDPFAGAVTRAVRLAALSIIVGGLAWQVLYGIGGMLAADQVLSVTGVVADSGVLTGNDPTGIGWPQPGSFPLNLWPVWIGLALLAVTAAFRYGEKVRIDNERLQRDTEGLV